jgi:hypothetical protein
MFQPQQMLTPSARAAPIYAHPPPCATKSYYISVDSRHRDRTRWPSSNRFEVRMDAQPGFAGAQIARGFKNVTRIELVNVIFPNTNSVLSEMYLFLSIPEIEGGMDTTNVGQRYFAKIVPGSVIGYYIQSHSDPLERPAKDFLFRGARLDKLTLELRTSHGELFDFGTDTHSANVAPNPLLQTSYTFKITVEENNRDD